MSDVQTVSQEFLTIGGNKTLGVELLVLVEALCTKARDPEQTLIDQDLQAVPDLIQKKTNLRMDLEVANDMGLAIYVIAPMGHSGNTGRNLGISTDGQDTAFYGKWLKSTIDLDQVTVNGQFRDIPFCLRLPRPFFAGALDLTPEEITATILHEVGHAFFSLATLGEYVLLNYYLTDGVDILLGKKANRYKIDVFDDSYLRKQLKPEDVEKLKKDPTEANYRRALLIAWRRKPRTHLMSKQGGDKRDEQLADMFASRMGFSRPLATALYKLMRSPTNRHMRTPLVNIMVEVGKFLLAGLTVTGTLLVPPIAPYLIVVYLIVEGTDNFNGGDYDNDYQRLTKIRRDMVAQLRDVSSASAYRKKLDDDIQAVDDLLKVMKDRTTGMMALMHVLIPGYRRGRQQLKHEELLESLLNNDLFLQAERFRR